MRPMLPALCLAAGVLRADALSDLRATLARLEGGDPVRLGAAYQYWNRSGDEGTGKVTQGQAEATIEDGPPGLRLGWSHEQLDQLKAEARKGKPAESAKRQALDALNAGKADQVVNGARILLEKLEGATLLEDRPDTGRDHAARLLVIRLDPRLDEEDRKHIKRIDDTLRLRLGPDGIPVAAEEQLDLKGSFLLIGFELHRKASRSYLHAGARLLLTREESEETGSGMGQHQQLRSVLTAKPS